MVWITALVVVALSSASPAHAGPELQFDLNTITTRITNNTGGGAFDENFTGSLRLGHNSLSSMARILIDGTSTNFDRDISDGNGWALSHFSAKINITDGAVVGGFIYLEVESFQNGVRTSEINTYEADIVAGIGAVRRQAGQGFRIDGLTMEGMFSDASFAGVDISPWFNAQPLAGSFINFSFDPGQNPFGEDQNSNVDIFVVVPLPLASVIGLAGVGILTLTRRRALDVSNTAV